jgi:hypothetical protein
MTNEQIALVVEAYKPTKDNNTYAWMEMVTGSVSEDDKGRSTRMFKLGRSVGIIEGVFTGRIRLEKVSPTTWQNKLGLRSKVIGETYSDRKRRFKTEAQRLFPEIKVTLATCDSLLIAYWGMGIKTGKLATL